MVGGGGYYGGRHLFFSFWGGQHFFNVKAKRGNKPDSAPGSTGSSYAAVWVATYSKYLLVSAF